MRPPRWPLGTVATTVVLVAAFAIDSATRTRRGLGPELLPALWVLDGVAARPWQFFSYALVHATPTHLVGNLLPLVPASLACEWRLGPARVFVAFWGLCVVAALGFHALDGRDLYGASGVAAAFVSMMGVLWGGARRSTRWQRAMPVVVAVTFFGFSEVWPALRHQPRPGALVHVAGALAGLVAGAVLLRREVHQTPDDRP